MREKVHFDESLAQAARWALADAQTNGGLLASVPSKDATKALRLLARAGINATAIGEVKRGPAGIDVRS